MTYPLRGFLRYRRSDSRVAGAAARTIRQHTLQLTVITFRTLQAQVQTDWKSVGSCRRLFFGVRLLGFFGVWHRCPHDALQPLKTGFVPRPKSLLAFAAPAAVVARDPRRPNRLEKNKKERADRRQIKQSSGTTGPLFTWPAARSQNSDVKRHGVFLGLVRSRAAVPG